MRKFSNENTFDLFSVHMNIDSMLGLTSSCNGKKYIKK
jgi:hypothetical protein